MALCQISSPGCWEYLGSPSCLLRTGKAQGGEITKRLRRQRGWQKAPGFGAARNNIGSWNKGSLAYPTLSTSSPGLRFLLFYLRKAHLILLANLDNILSSIDHLGLSTWMVEMSLAVSSVRRRPVRADPAVLRIQQGQARMCLYGFAVTATTSR